MTTLTTTPAAEPAKKLEFDFGVLPSEDGVPMETIKHRDQMFLLIDSLNARWDPRDDFFCGGNMFVHFSLERARNRDFRGPDFFVVLDVPRFRDRQYWASWDEDGRLPDVIVELLSESTEREDRTRKKDVYQNTFRTHEYFLYTPDVRDVEGFRLAGRYLPIRPDDRGWLWCEKLDCWFGFWTGTYLSSTGTWLRLFEKDGTMVLTAGERGKALAEAETKRAEAETKRAEAAEAELSRLRVELANRNSLGANGSAK